MKKHEINSLIISGDSSFLNHFLAELRKRKDYKDGVFDITVTYSTYYDGVFFSTKTQTLTHKWGEKDEFTNNDLE